MALAVKIVAATLARLMGSLSIVMMKDAVFGPVTMPALAKQMKVVEKDLIQKSCQAKALYSIQRIIGAPLNKWILILAAESLL